MSHTQTEQQQRKALNRLAVIWPTDWNPRVIDEYLRAVADLRPEVIDDAVGELIRTRTKRPTPAQIRDEALARHSGSARIQNRPTDAGVGCDRCRDNDEEGEWTQEPNDWIHCRTHNVAWRGILQ